MTTTRVTVLLSDPIPLIAFSNVSAKNSGGFLVHRTRKKKKKIPWKVWTRKKQLILFLIVNHHPCNVVSDSDWKAEQKSLSVSNWLQWWLSVGLSKLQSRSVTTFPLWNTLTKKITLHNQEIIKCSYRGFNIFWIIRVHVKINTLLENHFGRRS